MLERIAHFMEESGLLIEEANALAESGLEYWHSLVRDKGRNPISAGLHSDRMSARKIAIAEFLERQTYRTLAKADAKKREEWGLNLIPTACGFAAGFNQRNTIIRSVGEACERWAMSKWIDDQYSIEKQAVEDVVSKLDSVSLYFLNQFDRVDFYLKPVVIEVENYFLKFEIGQTMAFKGNGIYPGSSAQISSGGTIWQHALLESFRHLLLVKNNPDRGDYFPDNKIRHFAENACVAEAQITRADKKEWPVPKLRLLKTQSFEGDAYYVSRAIIDGWTSWTEGPIERFLY